MDLFRRKTKQGVFVVLQKVHDTRKIFTKSNMAHENKQDAVSCNNFRTNKLASFGFKSPSCFS